jgi:hypothetical protein
VFFIVVAGRKVRPSGEDDAFILEEEDASIERVRWELFFCDVSPPVFVIEKKIKKALDFEDGARRTNDYSAEKTGYEARVYERLRVCFRSYSSYYIFIKKSYYILFHSLSLFLLSLSHSRICFLRRGRARASTRVYVSHSHQFSLFSLIHSFTSSINYLLSMHFLFVASLVAQ